MNADLTLNSIVFVKRFDNESKSERASITRGINTPDILTIQSQEYVDSATKVPGQRFLLRTDRHDFDASLQKIDTVFYTIAQIPSTATQAQVDTALATHKAAIADASLMANVLAGQK
jgi:hypothetical protein